jgi:hypothetical protein
MAAVKLGHVAGLDVRAGQSALISAPILWLILSAIALFVLKLSPLGAILGGLAAAILHYGSELFHQIGHSIAARRTGYPMIGVRFFFVLAASIYPKDEPPLSGTIHIRRALGGPTASFLLALLLGVITLALNGQQGHTIWWLSLFLFLDNLLVFTLGAFLPLGFTDGSTILRWWGKP